jgi:hypothetical protein
MKRIRLFLIGLAIYGLGLGAADAQTRVQTGPITRIAVARGPSCTPFCRPARTTSEIFEDVQNAFVQIRVETASVLIARFASDASCVAQVGWCSVRILASSGPEGQFVELVPTLGFFEIFEVNDGSGARAIERSSFEVPPGLYTVKVQFSIPFRQMGDEFILDGWHLTVEAATAFPD